MDREILSVNSSLVLLGPGAWIIYYGIIYKKYIILKSQTTQIMFRYNPFKNKNKYNFIR